VPPELRESKHVKSLSWLTFVSRCNPKKVASFRLLPAAEAIVGGRCDNRCLFNAGGRSYGRNPGTSVRQNPHKMPGGTARSHRRQTVEQIVWRLRCTAG
jgi:hypothetical protein